MGNTQQKAESKQFIQHQKLGPTRVFQIQQKNQDGQIQQVPKMQITRNIQSKAVYDTWVNQLRKINDAQGLQLFLIPQQYRFQKAGLCGSSGVANLSFNKFEFVLSSQIKNRNNLNKFFQQTEIWYVLYNLVRAGNKFQILKQKIGDIHPNNILINQDGQTAIISNLSIPGQIDNFQKYLQDHKAEVFLAPQQMKQQDIQKGVYNQKVDKCLAQVFSLGMTLLSAGTLQHCNDVYQREPFQINNQRLNVLIQQFSKRYSSYLTQTLRTMLDFNKQTRVRSKKLYQTLSQYENKILDLEPFQVQTGYTPYGGPQSSPGYYNQPYYNVNQQQQQYGGYQNGSVNTNVPGYYQQSSQINHTNPQYNVRINDHNVVPQAKRF